MGHLCFLTSSMHRRSLRRICCFSALHTPIERTHKFAYIFKHIRIVTLHIDLSGKNTFYRLWLVCKLSTSSKDRTLASGLQYILFGILSSSQLNKFEKCQYLNWNSGCYSTVNIKISVVVFCNDTYVPYCHVLCY